MTATPRQLAALRAPDLPLLLTPESVLVLPVGAVEQHGPHLPFGMGIHGGLDETSIMLHLHPDRVDLAAGERNVPEGLAGNRYVRFGGPVSFGWLSDDFGATGVIGDPTGATAARGELLFRRAVDAFSEALGEVARFRFGH